MTNTTETPEDVDRLLTTARSALQEFEDAVDRPRLMQRLRSSSPAHPVLLFRFVFGALFVLCIVAAVALMVVTMVNDDIARTLAKFEAVIALPLPEEVPAIPALLGVLALTMALAWATATLAALSLGREAQLLPWERKEHQNLVNEVTRLTTQRAVMERIRGTPAGARPRIATPVPLGPRARPTAPAASTSPAGGAYGGFTRSTPSGASSYASGPSSSTFASSVMPPEPSTTATPGFGPRGTLANRPKPVSSLRAGPAPAPPPPSAPDSADHGTPEPEPDPDPEPESEAELGPDDPTAVAGGVRLGAPSTPTPTAGQGIGAAEYGNLLDGARPTSAPRPSTPPGGILGRARSGAVGHLRSTPFGSAGRVRPPPASTDRPPGEPPKPVAKPRQRLVSRPPPATRPAETTLPPPLAPLADGPVDEVVVMEEEDEVPTATGNDAARRRPPQWKAIDEEWLRSAVTKADALVRSFPQQAYLSYSQEPHLPFTLVVARATPATAVRAMVTFVEFLAGIATPPRARIELVGVAHLDRSFYKNVEAALEPHFGGNVEVEPNPGRIDIRFTEPDPQWGSHPVLPMS